ncbi:hypothetical protein GLAREA_03781 [Glarea lozoyensis ATCC 20868]|uniref:Uncharacterized protein n=1 Tax=Glarea lozoyensis (strain ATCC 20868 / MF5171) TaxID=1116229 RepID=S3D0Z8_GLAL2|nr:uncharacterized protein GLAREA_03781 [Glarea lozoyensis ATCC 20868]EPE30814.1 hypothetical protein GLAREA_03781 [Glarea lozoyensis ATCC 20868]
MSDSPRQHHHVAALADLPLTPKVLPPTVIIRLSSRREKPKPVPLLQLAVNNCTVVKYPNLRVEPVRKSLSKIYSTPNRAQALRESNKENTTMSSPSTANSKKARTERCNTATSQIPGTYPTSGEESDYTLSSRSVSMTSESATTHETITPATAIIPSTPSTNMNQSQLNKELPAKPILREAESPEKRGIYDATDANAHLIPFPPLTPRASDISLKAATTVTCEDLIYDSDTATLQEPHGDDQPSATDDIIQEYIGTSLQVLDISSPDVTIKQDIRTISSVSTLSRSPGMNSIPRHRRKSSVSVNGSPFSRSRKPKPKGSRSSVRGQNGYGQKGTQHFHRRDSVGVMEKGPREDLSRLDSDDEIEIFHDSTATSPIQADDDAQRSKKFDCGPTVRYSLDARQVIMGELREPESSKPLGSQRDGYNTPKAEETSPTRTTKQKQAGERRTLGQKDRGSEPEHKSIHPPRISSLQDSDQRMRTPSPAFVSRLARPTASSSAREAASKANMKNNKTLNNRSSIRPPSRQSSINRLSEKPGFNGRNSSESSTNQLPITNNANTIVSSDTSRKSLADSGTLESVKRAGKGLKSKFSNMLASRNRSRNNTLGEKINGRELPTRPPPIPRRANSRNLTTNENSGMSRTPSQVVRPYHNSVPLDDSLNQTINGPKNSSSSANNFDSSRLIPSIDHPHSMNDVPILSAASIADRSGDLTDSTLHTAQLHLVNIIQRAEEVTDENIRSNLVAIIEMLGVSIGQARELRIATIAQMKDNMILANKVRELSKMVLDNL